MNLIKKVKFNFESRSRRDLIIFCGESKKCSANFQKSYHLVQNGWQKPWLNFNVYKWLPIHPVLTKYIY